MQAQRTKWQSGFTPGRSTIDRVLTLNLIPRTRREYRQPLFAAYLDLKAAFDSVDRTALYKAFDIIGIPAKYIRLFQNLHTNTESCVKYEGLLSDWFPIKSGVRQGCVLAPDAFNVAMDQVLENSTSRMMLGTSVGEAKFTDLDFADDVVLFSELYGAIESALQIFEYEAATMGLKLNLLKTKTQSLSDFLPKPPDIWINGSRVECVDKFIYLGVSIDSSCSSSGEISRRIALANNAFGELRNTIWRTRIKEKTKIRLYSTYIIPILLYGSEAWSMTKRDANRVDAFGYKCLRSICNIHWSEKITNLAILKRTNLIPITDMIRRRRLSLFGHVVRQPDGSDTKEALFAIPPREWKRPKGRPKLSWKAVIEADLKQHNMGLHSGRRLAADRKKWARVVHHGATLP